MLRAWLVLLLAASICGCLAPGQPSTEAEVHVHVTYFYACPPGTTCASQWQAVAGASVYVDGRLANTTDSLGRASLRIPPGSTTICATHPDYGYAVATGPVDTSKTLEMRLERSAYCMD